LILFGLVWRRALYRYSGVGPPCVVNSMNMNNKKKQTPMSLSLPLSLSLRTGRDGEPRRAVKRNKN
jgi:hypothetical protein